MIFIIISDYLAIVSFFLIEMFARSGKETKKVTKTKYEKGSTDFTGYVIVASSILVFISPLANHFNLCEFNHSIVVGIIGLTLSIMGVTIRIVGMTTLGRFYTRTLKEVENHKLVTNGIYKYLRHPGYAGTILIFIGASLASGNIISFIVVTFLILSTYLYRIYVEEKMLIEIFGEQYKKYQKSSKKIIPFIY